MCVYRECVAHATIISAQRNDAEGIRFLLRSFVPASLVRLVSERTTWPVVAVGNYNADTVIRTNNITSICMGVCLCNKYICVCWRWSAPAGRLIIGMSEQLVSARPTTHPLPLLTVQRFCFCCSCCCYFASKIVHCVMLSLFSACCALFWGPLLCSASCCTLLLFLCACVCMLSAQMRVC